MPAYSLAEFKTLLSTGVAIGGGKLGLMTEMAQAGLKYLRDDEVAACTPTCRHLRWPPTLSAPAQVLSPDETFSS